MTATCGRLPPGQWRVQFRRKHVSLWKSFRIKAHGEQWAREQVQLIDRGSPPTAAAPECGETSSGSWTCPRT